MAATTILELPEFLEAILHGVDDMKTLLLAQRVIKVWHRTITNSKRLQEALFFRQRDRQSEDEPNQHNPLLLDEDQVYDPVWCLPWCSMSNGRKQRAIAHRHTCSCHDGCSCGVRWQASAFRVYLTARPEKSCHIIVEGIWGRDAWSDEMREDNYSDTSRTFGELREVLGAIV
nr:hypothetical protein B0A51_16158 [Rachicladosporium sp. CCFEE 5018]